MVNGATEDEAAGNEFGWNVFDVLKGELTRAGSHKGKLSMREIRAAGDLLGELVWWTLGRSWRARLLTDDCGHLDSFLLDMGRWNG